MNKQELRDNLVNAVLVTLNSEINKLKNQITEEIVKDIDYVLKINKDSES